RFDSSGRRSPLRKRIRPVRRDEPFRNFDLDQGKESSRRRDQERNQESRRRIQTAIHYVGKGSRRGREVARRRLAAANYANTSRFSAPHPVCEKQPADHARDEVRRGGAVASRSGGCIGGAAVRAGI